MHKLLKLISSLAIGLTILPIVATSTIIVEAKDEYNKYSMNGCSAYETAVVNNNGGFDHKGCYNSFSEAKTALSSLGDDGVIRHQESYSPTKIIAMNSGVIYSYGRRSGSNTVSFYQYGNSSDKTSYMTNYREGFYYSTDSYNGDGTGNVHVNISGFNGTIQLKNIDLIPMKFITSNKAIWLGGNDTTSQHESLWSIIPQRSYYKVVQNGAYKEIVYVAFGGWNDTDGQAAGRRFNSAIGPAADWMNVDDVYYSLNNYDFYSDMKCSNYVGTYYNYYQFLPLRSKSNIPASAYNSFLTNAGKGSSSKLWNQGETLLQAQETYGINALLLFAQAANESAYGTSYYAMNRNNLFGIAAYDDNPNNASTFSNASESILQQAAIYLRRYVDTDSAVNFGPSFGNKGGGITTKYASDIYYGLTIASIAYSCDKQYNNNSGTLTDFNSSTLGVINTYGTSIYYQPDTSSAVLYSSEYGASYQENHTVNILGEYNGFYKIQSTDLVYNGTNPNSYYEGMVTYDWDNMVGYIEKDKVNLISGDTVNSIIDSDSKILGYATILKSGIRIRKGPGTNFSATGYAMSEGSTVPVYNIVNSGGYTWYQFDNNKWFANLVSDNWASYTEVKESTDDSKDTTENETTITSLDDLTTTDTPSENTNVYASIKSVDYDETSHIVKISGNAYIKGMNASLGSVKHELLISDSETNKSYVIPCVTSANTVNMGDGYIYTAVKYTTSFDIDIFTSGNFDVGVQITNGSTKAYHSFFIRNTDFNIEYKTDDGKLVKLGGDDSANYKYILSVEKQSIDFSVVNKPSGVASKFGASNISLENGILSFRGYAGIYLTNMTSNDEPEYEILLEDEDGNLTTFDTSLSTNQVDISQFMYGDYTYNSCYFDVNASLTNLSEGTYRIYVHVKTNDAEDIYEAYSRQFKEPVSATYENRTYTLTRTATRNRYILTID